jgi:hypothetical protein
MFRSRVVAVSAALVVAASAGCGPSNGGGVRPGDYAKAVCASLLAWKRGVANDSALLSKQLQARSLDVRTVSAKYTAFFRGVVTRTDALLEEIGSVGAPAVDSGAYYARDLRAALAQARAGLADARARFAALPADDLRSYAAGAARIRDQLGRVFLDADAALGRLGRTYSDKALNSAFEDQPDCRSLA